MDHFTGTQCSVGIPTDPGLQSDDMGKVLTVSLYIGSDEVGLHNVKIT